METSRGNNLKRIYAGLSIVSAFIAVFIFGFWVRAYKLPTMLNTECWDITNAIRLHYLPLFNLKESIRFNFAKSFFMGMHGTVDSLYWYFISGIYDLLGIPISEHNIYLAQVILGMSLILIMAIFVWRLFGRNMKIALFSSIFGILNLDHIMAMSRSHWFYNSEKVLELLTYFAVFFVFAGHKKTVCFLSLGALMFLNATTPNVAILPMVLLFYFFLYAEKNGGSLFYSAGAFIKDILKFKEAGIFFILIPYCFGLIIDYFVQRTIGVSGLGLFGHVVRDYGFNLSANIAKGLSEVRNQFKLTPDYFYNILLIPTILGGAYCLLKGKTGKYAKRYAFLLILFFYHFAAEVCFGRFYLYDLFIPAVLSGGAGLYFTLSALNSAAAVNKLMKTLYYLAVFAFLVLLILVCADRINLAARRDKGSNLIACVPNFNNTEFDTFYSRINPLKTAGYYLRKHSDKNDKIYLLFGGDAWIGNAEYYFGKKAMMTEFGYNKQLFNNSYPLEFYRTRDGVEVFDYYVVVESLGYSDYYRNILAEAQNKGVKKVADITYEGKVYASIYSPKNVVFQVLEMEEYDKKWDNEYANLRNIYENKLVGLVSLWGCY